MGLMDRIFNFVGAIVGGIIVKALPRNYRICEKNYETSKTNICKKQEGLKPVFNFIGGLFKDKGTYDSEKEKVDGDIEQAQLISKDIDGQGR